MVLVVALIVALSLWLASVSHMRDRQRAIQGLSKVLDTLNVTHSDADICYRRDVRWSGTIAGKRVELTYFSHHKLGHDSLAILIPFRTRRVLHYSNRSGYLPSQKGSFEAANEIFLASIENPTLKPKLEALLEDRRFVRLQTRWRDHERKFATLPKYDERHRVVNDRRAERTHALSIRIGVPRGAAPETPDPIDRDYLLAMIRLLYDVRHELARKRPAGSYRSNAKRPARRRKVASDG